MTRRKSNERKMSAGMFWASYSNAGHVDIKPEPQPLTDAPKPQRTDQVALDKTEVAA